MLNGENNFKIKVNKEIKSRDAEFCQACNKCDTTYVYQAENHLYLWMTHLQKNIRIFLKNWV